jgi:hypothetical protein
MDGLGTGCGLSRSPLRRRGVGSFWGGVKKAAKGAAKVAHAPLDLTKRALPKSARRVIDRAERMAWRGAKSAGKLAASYAGAAGSVVGGAAAGAGCAMIGVPAQLCAKGGAALGKAAGNALSRRLGVPVRELPGGVDPSAVLSGNPQELLKLAGGLAKKAGVNVPLTKEELVFVAGRKLGLPPETMAVAQSALAQVKA